MQILNSPGKCKYQIGVYKCDKILHFRLHNDFRKYNNNFFFILAGLTTIRETLKNRNITTDARALRTRHALHEDSSDTEEGSGEEVPVAMGGTDRCQNSDPILEVSQKNGGIRGQKVDVGSPGQSEEAEGDPLGEADPWPGTDQNNRLLYE